jgi:hypothetical protein
MDGFGCSMAPNSACWDHFLWDRLGQKFETEDAKDGENA